MFQKLLRFTLALCFVTGSIYAAHRFVLHSFFSNFPLDFLHFSYKFNFGITLIFTSMIILISEKLKDQIGFVFLAEGILKLALLLYLTNILGFDMNRSNFLVFFIPYLSCLGVGLFFVLKILRNLDSSNNE